MKAQIRKFRLTTKVMRRKGVVYSIPPTCVVEEELSHCFSIVSLLLFLLSHAGLGATCGISCSERPDCRNCTQATCMWCLNLNTCIDRNAYLASFPYGQCMDWTTEHKDCPAPPSDRAKNRQYYTQLISDCLSTCFFL